MIFETIQNVLSELLHVPADSITEDTNIVEDLGADSLDIAELLSTVEDEFGITIPDEDAPELTTIGKFIDYIEARQ